MEVLRFVQSKLKLLGLTSTRSMENQFKLRVVNILGFVCLAIFFVFESVFIYKANRFFERMESIYVISATIVIAMGYATLTFQMSTLIELIKGYEAVINESVLNFHQKNWHQFNKQYSLKLLKE